MSDDLIRKLRSGAVNTTRPDADDYITCLLDKAANEIDRLRSALLGHMQREGQDCDAFERGRRVGLEEAAKIVADHERALARCDAYLAAETAQIIHDLIRAKLETKP